MSMSDLTVSRNTIQNENESKTSSVCVSLNNKKEKKNRVNEMCRHTTIAALSLLLLLLLSTIAAHAAHNGDRETMKKSGTAIGQLQHLFTRQLQHLDGFSHLMQRVIHEYMLHTKYGAVSDDGTDTLVDNDLIPISVRQVVQTVVPAGGPDTLLTHSAHRQRSSGLGRIASQQQQINGNGNHRNSTDGESPCHEDSIWAEYSILWVSCSHQLDV